MKKISKVGLFGVTALLAGGLSATHGWSDWDPDLTRTPHEAGQYLDHAEVARMGGVGNYVTPEEVHIYDMKLAQQQKVREDNYVSSFSVIQPSDYRAVNNTPSQLTDEGMVFFAPAQSTLTQRGKAELANIADQLARNSSAIVQVDGYADSMGDAGDNQDLAKSRALCVKNELIRDGVEASQIRTRAFGENEPVATNDREMGRALNRRAEVYVEMNPVSYTNPTG
jgi:outer membrane protein OmpA-like peptidoglycan-associated protein